MSETQHPYNTPQEGQRGGYHITPNSTEVMVLGILSIVLCWCWGVVSVILGIVTLVMAGQGEKLYRLNPSMYSESSYRNLKTGKICAIIGLTLAGLSLIAAILYFVIFGTFFWNVMRSSWEY